MSWIPRQAGWRNGETSNYDVLRDSEVTGRTTVGIYYVDAKPVPLYCLTTVNTAIAAGMTILHDSIAALLTRDSLNSVSAFQVRNQPARQETIVSQYQNGKVILTSTGGQTTALDAPANTFDNSILLTVLRTLDLKPGARYELTSVASFGPWTKPADISSLGDETITVPAGTFVCNHVALEIAGYTLDLWYEKDPPHRYVKFENKAGNSSAVLSSYEPGH